MALQPLRHQWNSPKIAVYSLHNKFHLVTHVSQLSYKFWLASWKLIRKFFGGSGLTEIQWLSLGLFSAYGVMLTVIGLVSGTHVSVR